MTKVHDEVEITTTIKVIGGDYCAPTCLFYSPVFLKSYCSLMRNVELCRDSDSGLCIRWKECIDAEERQISKESLEENGNGQNHE